MDGGAGPGAEVLSPGEAEWPPELRLPPPPPPVPASLRGYAAPAPHLHLQPPAAAAPREEEVRPPPRHAEGGFDDQQFLGSIMGDAAPHQQQHQQPQPAAAAAPVKRKRGRPPKNRDGAPPTAAPAPVKPVKKKDEEVVCFICFDGGDLVVCDRRYVSWWPFAAVYPGTVMQVGVWLPVLIGVTCAFRGCPKVYHPACIKRDESFFRSRGKWDCGELILFDPVASLFSMLTHFY